MLILFFLASSAHEPVYTSNDAHSPAKDPPLPVCCHHRLTCCCYGRTSSLLLAAAAADGHYRFPLRRLQMAIDASPYGDCGLTSSLPLAATCPCCYFCTTKKGVTVHPFKTRLF